MLEEHFQSLIYACSRATARTASARQSQIDSVVGRSFTCSGERPYPRQHANVRGLERGWYYHVVVSVGVKIL